jgi:hypothetical protein
VNKPFPKSLFTHSALTAAERAALASIDEEELAASAYIGLLVLLEGILMERVPGLHCQYTPARSTANVEGAALCRSLLHPDLGFSADQIAKGRTWLTHPGPSLTNLLAFYFRLRQKVRNHQLTAAKQDIIARFGLTPTN